VTVKTFLMIQKVQINAVLLKNKMYEYLHTNMKQLFSTPIIIINVS